MTENERDRLLLTISNDVAEIKVKLANDHRILYGNGHPGLVENHSSLEKRVQHIEDSQSAEEKHYGAAAIVIGFAVNVGISLYALFK